MVISHLKKLVSVVCVAFVSACTSMEMALVNIPVDEDTLTISKDIAYGDEPIQKLDIYKAKNSGENLPVLIFFYGGGYSDGSKDTYLFLGDYFARKGYVVVIPDYSKYPQVKFPTFVEDSAKAVAWTKANISKYGGDNNKAILMGHSAGAHIAALLNYDEKYLKNVGVDSSYIKAFVGLAGPYSFTPDEQKYKNIFGPPTNYPNMQVDNFVDGNEAPALLLYGTDDDVVAPYNLTILENAIKQKHGEVKSKIFADTDHIAIIGAYTQFWNDEKITKFVDEYLSNLKN